METVMVSSGQSVSALQLEADSLKAFIDQRDKWIKDPNNFDRSNYSQVKADTSEMRESYSRTLDKINELKNKNEKSRH